MIKMKYKVKKNANLTLSDKIADALTIKPKADIEDDQVFGTKPQTVSRADFGSSGSDEETEISDFRKRNVTLLSNINKKYEGQVVSRRDIGKEQSDESLDDTGSDIENGEPQGSQNGKVESDEEIDESASHEPQSQKNDLDSEDFDSDGGESDDYSITRLQKDSGGSDSDTESDEDVDGEGYDVSQMDTPVKEDFEHVKKQNISEEAKKGESVRNQLLLWEGLLEMRIHLQRCMNTANQMPMPDIYPEYKKHEEFAEESNQTKTAVVNILDKLLTLQSMLFKNNPETKKLSTKNTQASAAQAGNKEETKEESDEEIPSDTDNEEIPSDTDAEEDTQEKQKPKTEVRTQKKRKLTDYEKELSVTHKAFKSFRDSTIQKWNEKTRLATAANIKTSPTNTILQQISYILSDRDKLVRRTQLKRSEYDIIGYKKPIDNEIDSEATPIVKSRKDDDEYITEIFDDSDFYHQLLRELIECKSADISDPVQLSRQWITLQQMRSKMKRKVDTKATKGRKIKYVVHNQLVNYMAPEKCISWTDESTNELYSSLFGKMFEQNNIGMNANLGDNFKLKN